MKRFLFLFILFTVACSKEPINTEVVTPPVPETIYTLSERYSQINETTGYFKGQEFFSEYLTKQYTWDILSAPYDGHTHWHTFHKNSAVLDFDGDGNQDIVAFASSFCNDHVYSFHKGKFLFISDYKNNSSPTIIDSDHYFGSGKMEVNDFDNDGVSEILFYSTESKMNTYNEEENVGGHTNIPPLPPTLLDFSNGNFNTRFLGLAGDSHTGASGDIDNDGDIDFIQWMVPSNYNGESIEFVPTLQFNNGNLSFTSKPLIIDLPEDPWSATTVDLFDLNNDGNLDVILGWRVGVKMWNEIYPNFFNSLSGPIIMFGDGTGNFSRSNSLELPSQFLESKNIAASILGFGFTDYDSDGDIDILVSTTRDEPGGTFDNGRYYDNYYLLIYTNSNGSFTDTTSSNIIGSFDNDFNFPNFYHIRTIDIDEDGDYDIIPDAIANWGTINYSSSLHWKNNNGKFIRN